MSDQVAQILKQGELDVKFPVGNPERKVWKAWHRRWVSVVVVDGGLSLRLSASGGASATWSANLRSESVFFRSQSRSRPRRVFGVTTSGRAPLIHLAGRDERHAQEWMDTLREALSPDLHPNDEWRAMHLVSVVDNDLSWRLGLLGAYGRLEAKDDTISVIHPHDGHFVRQWTLDRILDAQLLRLDSESNSSGVFSLTLQNGTPERCQTLSFYSPTAQEAVRDLEVIIGSRTSTEDVSLPNSTSEGEPDLGKTRSEKDSNPKQDVRFRNRENFFDTSDGVSTQNETKEFRNMSNHRMNEMERKNTSKDDALKIVEARFASKYSLNGNSSNVYSANNAKSNVIGSVNKSKASKIDDQNEAEPVLDPNNCESLAEMASIDNLYRTTPLRGKNCRSNFENGLFRGTRNGDAVVQPNCDENSKIIFREDRLTNVGPGINNLCHRSSNFLNCSINSTLMDSYDAWNNDRSDESPVGSFLYEDFCISDKDTEDRFSEISDRTADIYWTQDEVFASDTNLESSTRPISKGEHMVSVTGISKKEASGTSEQNQDVVCELRRASVISHTYADIEGWESCRRPSAGGITLYEEMDDDDDIEPSQILPPSPPPRRRAERPSTLENLSRSIAEALAQINQRAQNSERPGRWQGVKKILFQNKSARPSPTREQAPQLKRVGSEPVFATSSASESLCSTLPGPVFSTAPCLVTAPVVQYRRSLPDPEEGSPTEYYCPMIGSRNQESQYVDMGRSATH